MIAQIRGDDEDVFLALEKSGYIESAKNPSGKLIEKLSKIRCWINSTHFPEDLKIQINEDFDSNLLIDFDFSVKEYLTELVTKFKELDEWSSVKISQSINLTANEMEINLRDVYKLLYLIILGKNSGPKLARLLEELDKNKIHSLLLLATN